MNNLSNVLRQSRKVAAESPVRDTMTNALTTGVSANVLQRIINATAHQHGMRSLTMNPALAGIIGGGIGGITGALGMHETIPGDAGVSEVASTAIGNGLMFGGLGKLLLGLSGKNSAKAGALMGLLSGAGRMAMGPDKTMDDMLKQIALEKQLAQMDKTAGVFDLFTKYVGPRFGNMFSRWKTLGGWAGNKAKSWVTGAQVPTYQTVNAPFAKKYLDLQTDFNALGTPARLGYGIAKQVGALPLMGVTAASMAYPAFKGTIEDKIGERRNEEIGKAVGSAREYVQRAFADPSTRIKLGLGALFNPSAASGQIDEMLQGMGQNAMRQ